MKTSLLSDIRINLMSESNIAEVGHHGYHGPIQRKIYLHTSRHVGVLGSTTIPRSVVFNSLHVEFFVQQISPAVLGNNTSIMQLLCV